MLGPEQAHDTPDVNIDVPGRAGRNGTEKLAIHTAVEDKDKT